MEAIGNCQLFLRVPSYKYENSMKAHVSIIEQLLWLPGRHYRPGSRRVFKLQLWWARVTTASAWQSPGETLNTEPSSKPLPLNVSVGAVAGVCFGRGCL